MSAEPKPIGVEVDPDPDVHALQTVDALARRLIVHLRPALLRAEQRQRDREARRDKAAAKKQPTPIRDPHDGAPLLEAPAQTRSDLPADDRKIA